MIECSNAFVNDFLMFSIGSLAAEEEQLMPHPKGDETQPNPITHQTAWALLHDARIYVKSIYEIKSQASS